MFLNLILPVSDRRISLAFLGFRTSSRNNDLTITDKDGRTATVPDHSPQWENLELSVTRAPENELIEGVSQIPAFCLVEDRS